MIFISERRVGTRVSRLQGLNAPMLPEASVFAARSLLNDKRNRPPKRAIVDFETLQLWNPDSSYPFDSRFFNTSNALFSCSSVWFFGFTSFLSSGAAC